MCWMWATDGGPLPFSFIHLLVSYVDYYSVYERNWPEDKVTSSIIMERKFFREIWRWIFTITYISHQEAHYSPTKIAICWKHEVIPNWDKEAKGADAVPMQENNTIYLIGRAVKESVQIFARVWQRKHCVLSRYQGIHLNMEEESNQALLPSQVQEKGLAVKASGW